MHITDTISHGEAITMESCSWIRFISRIPFLVFSGILIGYIILFPPKIVFLKPITMLLPAEEVLRNLSDYHRIWVMLYETIRSDKPYWLYFCGVCQTMPLKVWPNSSGLQPSINLRVCSYNLFVQLLWYPIYYTRTDEGLGKPCAVDQASYNIGTHSGLEPGTSGSTVHSSNNCYM